MALKKEKTEEVKFYTVTNLGLKCKDCANKIENPVGKCMVYPRKPNEVLCGGDCDYYVKANE